MAEESNPIQFQSRESQFAITSCWQGVRFARQYGRSGSRSNSVFLSAFGVCIKLDGSCRLFDLLLPLALVLVAAVEWQPSFQSKSKLQNLCGHL